MNKPSLEFAEASASKGYEVCEADAIYNNATLMADKDAYLKDSVEFSANYFLSSAQQIILAMVLCLTMLALYVAPDLAKQILLISVNGCCLASAVLRVYLFVIGQRLRAIATKEEHRLMDDELPTYSIILPLHKEGQVLAQIVRHINSIDYPKEMLKVFLVLERSDEETIEALKHVELPVHFKVLYVPKSYPQTKPKACNYALKYVKSELLVIYDAEDIPDPMQLRRVAAVFKAKGDKVDCVQCQLSFYNNENWLCAMFALEYRILFEYILVALDYLNMPIPLGGTSNHLRVDKLRQVGGWDSFNVTEDAELGIRLSRNGMKTCVLASRTNEEAPNSVIIWIKQRTRWIKGYMQTYAAHTRHPIDFIKKVGGKQFCLWSLLVFVPMINFIALPIMILISVFSSTDSAFALGIMIVFNSVSLLYCSYHAKKSNNYTPVKIIDKWWWSYPLYFILHSVAAIRAVYQLFTALHLWEKTPHGVTKTLVP